MNFLSPELPVFLKRLEVLTSETKAIWGSMSAQRMVEHLSDCINMSLGVGEFKLQIPEDKIPAMQRFLLSEKPMARGSKVDFAPENFTLRNEDLADAIDEFTLLWVDFEEYYEENPNSMHLHPFYGELNFEQWKLLHSKHFTHHFEQFGIL